MFLVHHAHVTYNKQLSACNVACKVVINMKFSLCFIVVLLTLLIEIRTVPHDGYKHHERFIRTRGKRCTAGICKMNSLLMFVIFWVFSCCCFVAYGLIFE